MRRLVATCVVIAGLAVMGGLVVRPDGDTTQLGVGDAADTSAVAPAPNSAEPESDLDPPRDDIPGKEATNDEPPLSDTTDSDTTDSDTTDSGTTRDSTEIAVELENFGPRMSLTNLDGWLNTEITSLDDLAGQVVLVEMWTFGCRNCKARLPYNQRWYETYREQGFEIVGVHAPEFSFEAEVANIEQALVDLNVTWPVALDTDKRNFHRWQPGTTGYWPRSYLIDQNGDIRFDHIGEGSYDELEAAIEYLLANPPDPAA